jgi:DNA-binding CsgD family transcriptional regulator
MADIDLDLLIGDIYEAALDRALWPGVLERLGDALGRASAIISVQDFSSGSLWKSTARLDVEVLEVVSNALAYSANPFTEVLPRLPVGRPVLVDELFHPVPYLRTELYHTFCKALGMGYDVLVPLVKDEHSMAQFSVGRSARDKNFDDADIRLLRRLIPHLQRAMRIDLTLAASKARLDGFAALLDGLATAALLLDSQARPLYANTAADRLLGRNDGLGVCRGQIAVTPPNSPAAFARVLDEAARRVPDGRAAPAFPLARPSGRRPYTALAAPFPRDSERAAWSGELPVVMLFISDPEATPRPQAELLRVLYGLTPMESRLAVLLAEGRELREAAEALRVSPNTAKTHLKEVFAKTGARRQAELVRLLLVANLGGVALPGTG